jgi:DNA-directed RNA polymerase subunit RPC12/RpoP
MSDLSVGLSCPSCGGAITIKEGDNVVNCQYCGSTLFVEGDQGVQTIAFKNKMGREAAVNAAQFWWKKGFKARDLRKTGAVTECYPIYLPFWSIGTRVAGWVCGYEERTHTDSKGRSHTEKVYKEEMVLQDLMFSEIACDPGDLGLRTMSNFTGESAFEDFDMIPTFESTTSHDDANEHAKADSMARGRASAHIPHVTFERLHVLTKKTALIYYPVWVVRYTYRDRMYILTVDGVTGLVLSGRAPGDPLFQSLAVTAGTSLGGLAAAGGILFTISSGSEFGIAGVIFGLIVLGATYFFFRHGSEIIEGDFPDKKKMMNLKQMADIGKTIGGAYR